MTTAAVTTAAAATAAAASAAADAAAAATAAAAVRYSVPFACVVSATTWLFTATAMGWLHTRTTAAKSAGGFPDVLQTARRASGSYQLRLRSRFSASDGGLCTELYAWRHRQVSTSSYQQARF